MKINLKYSSCSYNFLLENAGINPRNTPRFPKTCGRFCNLYYPIIMNGDCRTVRFNGFPHWVIWVNWMKLYLYDENLPVAVEKWIWETSNDIVKTVTCSQHINFANLRRTLFGALRCHRRPQTDPISRNKKLGNHYIWCHKTYNFRDSLSNFPVF